eukprot:Em0296g3a
MFQCPICEEDTSIPVGGASVLPQNLHLGFEVEVEGYMSKMVTTVSLWNTSANIGRKKRTLLSELEAISLSKTTALTLQKEQFETMVGDIGHYTDMASQILQTHTDHEIVALGGLIPTELQATLKRVQTISLTPNQHSNVTVSVQTDDLVRKTVQIGEIIVFFSSPSSSTWMSTSVARVGTRYPVKVQSKTSKGEEYPHGGVEVKGEMRSKTHNGAVVYGEVEDHRDGTYTITLTPQTAGPHQLLITMDGQHVQNSPNDLDKLTSSGKFLHKFGQQGSDQGQFNRPMTVIIDSNNKLIVSDSDNCDHSFQSPWGLALDPQGNIHVAAGGSNPIKVFTKEGVYVRMYGGPNHPSGIAIDGEGYRLVRGQRNPPIYSKYYRQMSKATNGSQCGTLHLLHKLSWRMGKTTAATLQSEDGDWSGDYRGPLLDGWEQKSEMKQYPRNVQYTEGKSTVFGTALNYVTMRLLGVARDDPDVATSQDTATTI